MRLFVAIELPDTWKQGLGEVQSLIQQQLARDRRTSSARPRWVNPEGIHLTLKFIGEVTDDRLETIEQQLALAVSTDPGVTLSVAGPGSFGGRRAPRILWIGLLSSPQHVLSQLAAVIQASLVGAGVPAENRDFTPHLTLARLPDGLPDDVRRHIAEVAAATRVPSFPPFQVSYVSLMRSHLGPGGARYERLASWPI